MTEPEQKESGAKRRKPKLTKFHVFTLALALVVVGVIGVIELTRKYASPGGPDGGSRGKPSEVGAAGEFPRQLTDGSGRTITVKARPQRIVSQTLGTDEILLAICQPERIIAFSMFALDPEYSNVVDLARKYNARRVDSTEDILTLNPDLIFIASYSRAEIAEQLQATGAPVFRFESFNRIENIKNNIRTVGYATGDEARAAEVVAEMDRRLAASRARIPQGVKPPRVLSYGVSGSTAGGDTLFDDILHTVGAVNVAAEGGLKGFHRVSAEQLTEWQPDFIITGSGMSGAEDTRRRLLDNPAVATSKAARDGRIIIMDNRSLLTVSHHIVNTVDALIDELYGTPPSQTR